MKTLLLACATLVLSVPALAQKPAALTVDFANPGLTPAHWVITLAPDGSGHFHSERGNAPMDPAQSFEVANIDRDIQIEAGLAASAFSTAHRRNLFEAPCESHMKVAFQGSKTFSYSGSDGTGSCTFNYSKDKEIQGLADTMVSVAAGIIEGARLETLLQHDRLGLDKETEYLLESVGDGRVQQLCTIKGILQRLADDPQVMDRVRKRAKSLLVRAQR